MTRMYHNLPVDAYTSQEWFDREQRLIFSRTWRYAGLVEDVPEPRTIFSLGAALVGLFGLRQRRRNRKIVRVTR